MNEVFDDGKFAGIRDESLFFSPLASSSAAMISTKHVLYILISPISIALMVGFDMLNSIFLILIPFTIFMGVYTHKGVQMEYVLYYLLMFLALWKKEKSVAKKIQKKTTPLFLSRSFGVTEMSIKGKTRSKGIRTIKVNDPDELHIIDLTVGTVNRLVYVDVDIGNMRIATHVPVESDGTLVVAFIPGENIGTQLTKVMHSGTGKVIASENIILEIKK